MSRDLWTAVDDLAAVWRTSPSVQQVSSVVRRDGSASRSPLATMLDDLSLRGLRAHPLRFGSDIRQLLDQPFNAHVTRPDGYEEWVNVCQQVERAFLDQLAWLRAQIPGYPLIPAPHLVRGAPLTEPRLFGAPAWSRRDMGRGFQLASPPSLRIGAQKIEVSKQLRAVAAALSNSEAWQQFDITRSGLTEADTEALRSVNHTLRAALTPEMVAQNAPASALGHAQYRQQQLDGQLASLDGGARAIVDSFTLAADAVDFAVDEVLPQLVIHGRPRQISVMGELDWLEDDVVTFISDEPLLQCGELRVVTDPMLEEVGQIREVTVVVDPGAESTRVTMRMIPGAGASWSL